MTKTKTVKLTRQQIADSYHPGHCDTCGAVATGLDRDGAEACPRHADPDMSPLRAQYEQHMRRGNVSRAE